MSTCRSADGSGEELDLTVSKSFPDRALRPPSGARPLETPVFRHSPLAVLAAALLTLTLVATEDAPTYTEATETLYISAGCPTDATGSCTSTRWLGKQTGDATSNYRTSVTPVDEVYYRANGSLNWRDYPSDLTFPSDGYLLDDTRDLGVTVTIMSNGNGGAGAEVTVHTRAQANVTLADGTTTNRTLEVDSQTVPTMTTLDGPVPVEFAIDLPDDLAGATLNRLTIDVALHGINVQNGYIDQQGGSPVTIPHLVEAVTPPTTTG